MKIANIGRNIAELRKSKKKTAEQLAEALRVSRQTISKWENGETIPNAYNVLDMATYLDVNVSDIYGQILADRIVKDTVNSKDKSFVDEINDTLMNSHSDGLDEKKNIKEAISNFDRNFIAFSVKTGFNIIKYEEILRRVNLGYVMGIKESDYPVETQRLKPKSFMIPAFARFLTENGLLAFFHDDDDVEAALYLILRDEHEILRFKELTRVFFVGLAEFRNHKWMRCLIADVENRNEESRYRYNVSIIDSNFIINNEATFDDCAMNLLLTDDEDEIDFVINRLAQLDEPILKEFLENCHGDLIAVDDKKNEKSFIVYDFKEGKSGSNLGPIEIRKEHDYDICFISNNDAESERKFSKHYYASFNKREEAEAEINNLLNLDEPDLKQLLEKYDNAEYIVLFDNRQREWSIYDVNNLGMKEIIAPNYTHHPEPVKLKFPE